MDIKFLGVLLAIEKKCRKLSKYPSAERSLYEGTALK